MALHLEHAGAEICGRDYYIDGLHRHIEFIERFSTAGIAASQAATTQIEAFYQKQLAAANNSNTFLNT